MSDKNIKELNPEEQAQNKPELQQFTTEQLRAMDEQMQREFTIIRVRSAHIELKKAKYDTLMGMKENLGKGDSTLHKEIDVELINLTKAVLETVT